MSNYLNKTGELESKLETLESKIKELEALSNSLNEALSNTERQFNSLIVKFGDKIGARIDHDIDCHIDELEYRMLKKLLDGEHLELKMREKGCEQ